MRYSIRQRAVTGEDVEIAAFTVYDFAKDFQEKMMKEYRGIVFALYEGDKLASADFEYIEEPATEAPEGHGALRINKALTDLFTDAFIPPSKDYLHINVTEFNPPITFPKTPDMYADMNDVLARIAIDVLKDCVHDIEEHDNDAAAQWLNDQNLSVESAKAFIKIHGES